jgi:elongation factor Ts
MAKITAADVGKLRQMTGSGMMDCKKALQESDGDFDKAIEYLRKKGQKVANKRADKEATEGCIISKTNDDNTFGVIVALNCETDFVAKNQDFVDFTHSIADLAIKNKAANLDELNALKMENGRTVQDNVTDMTGKIGEKIDLSKYELIENESVAAYIHPGNKISTLVGLNKDGYEETGREIAMQIAAMAPVAVRPEEVPQKVIDTEIEIGKDQARQEGKPEEMLEKIAKGKLNKFYKESTLLNQSFVRDTKITVDQYLKSKDKDLTVNKFYRFALGE